MSKVLSFEYNRTSFNVNYDIIWSFKFALVGNSLSDQGGFTTFLRKPSAGTLSGGGPFESVGYLPAGATTTENALLAENNPIILTENGVDLVTENQTSVAATGGIVGSFLAIGFDTSGVFALSTTLYGGITSTAPNSLTIRGGDPDYSLIYTAQLSSLDTNFTLLTTDTTYCWLRFRLGDVCSRIYIDYRYGDGSTYLPLTSIPLELTFTDSTLVNVGISYASSLTSTDLATTTFNIKSFSVEGTTITTPTSTTYTNLTSVGETILIAQSGGNVATQDEHIVLT